jgi:energy-converting hydrogenase Eha subunit A
VAAGPDQHPRLRLRAVIAALVAVPAVTLFAVWGDWLEGGNGAAQSLNSFTVGLLAVLTAANMLLRRRKPAWAFSPGELIAIYLVVATCMSITGGVWQWGGSLPAIVAYPVWVAGAGNQYADTILPNLPPGLVVTDRAALEGFMLGGSTPYRMEVLRAWLAPMLWWTAWVSATLWVTLCLSVIVHRRWSEEEKLPFPMTIVPMELTDPSEKTFRNRIWWLGMGLSASLGSLGILHSFFPSVPVVTTAVEIESLIMNNPPWDAIRGIALYWGLWQIGLCYLMPLDFAFSLIVFNLFWKAEYIFSRWGGWLITPWSGFPHGDQQNIGAYLAVMASVIWLDRRYLGQVLRRAIGMPSALDDRNEGLTYRTAVIGLLGGLGFLWFFYTRAGMRAPTTAAFMILYFTMVMAIVRMRAQIGPPAHWMFGTMPEFMLTQFPGTGAIAPRGLGMIAIMRPFMFEQDANPIPIQLEGLRMAERGVVRPRHLTYALVVAVPLVMLSYFWASVHIGYKFGLEAKAPADLLAICNDMLGKLDAWLRDPSGPNYGGTISIGIGALIALALMALKLRLPMFPLHPMAFPLAFSWTIDALLPAIIIAWAVKAVLLRYGGLRAHQRALPFFLGLIVGDASISLIGTVLSHALLGR